MQKRVEQSEEYLPRRRVLQSFAGLVLASGLIGCGQAAPPPQTQSASKTPTTLKPGSVLYSYRGHTERAVGVAWSPDGKYIASASLDKTVQVWGANPAEHFTPVVYKGHTDGVQTVAWSPDSLRIVSGSLDKSVQIWNAFTKERSALLQGHTDIVMSVAWSPDGKYVASGSGDGTVRVWDVATARQKLLYKGHSASVHSVDWASDSRRLASGSEDKTAQVLDVETGKTLFTYRGHKDTVCAVSWSPDGKYIASGSWDKTAQVWDAESGKVLYTYDGYRTKEAAYDISKGVRQDLILALAWSHNGRRIAAVTQVYCGDSCAVVLVWDALTMENFTFYIDMPVFALAWSPDDTRLVTSFTLATQRSMMQDADGYYVQITEA